MKISLSDGVKLLSISDATIRHFVEDAKAQWTERAKIHRHFCTFNYVDSREITVVVIQYPWAPGVVDIFLKEELDFVETAMPRLFSWIASDPEKILMSEAVFALRLSPDFVNDCIDKAKKSRLHDAVVDIHCFHFTRKGQQLCICVVLHPTREDVPTIVFMGTEADELVHQLVLFHAPGS
jgi:hypothetical protein